MKKQLSRISVRNHRQSLTGLVSLLLWYDRHIHRRLRNAPWVNQVLQEQFIFHAPMSLMIGIVLVLLAAVLEPAEYFPWLVMWLLLLLIFHVFQFLATRLQHNRHNQRRTQLHRK